MLGRIGSLWQLVERLSLNDYFAGGRGSFAKMSVPYSPWLNSMEVLDPAAFECEL
jgi:hypothetical protein